MTFTVGAGVCPVYGCTDTAAVNFDASAMLLMVLAVILGCTLTLRLQTMMQRLL